MHPYVVSGILLYLNIIHPNITESLSDEVIATTCATACTITNEPLIIVDRKILFSLVKIAIDPKDTCEIFLNILKQAHCKVSY